MGQSRRRVPNRESAITPPARRGATAGSARHGTRTADSAAASLSEGRTTRMLAEAAGKSDLR